MNRKRSAQVKTNEINEEFQKEIISFIQSLYTSEHCLDVVKLMMTHNMLPQNIHSNLEIKYKYYKFKGPQLINSDAQTFLQADLNMILQSNISEHFRANYTPVLPVESGGSVLAPGGRGGIALPLSNMQSKGQTQSGLPLHANVEPIITKQRAYSLINTSNNYNKYNNNPNNKPSIENINNENANGSFRKCSFDKVVQRKFSAQLDSHVSKESPSKGIEVPHRSKRLSLGNADFAFGSGLTLKEGINPSTEINPAERMSIEEPFIKSEEVERKESMTQGSDSEDSMKEGLGQKGNGKNSKKGMKYHLNIDKPFVWQHFIFEKEIMTYLSMDEMNELLKVDRKELVKLKKNSMTIFHNAFKKYLKNKGKKRLLEEKINTYERNDSVFFYAHFFSKVLASKEKSTERELYTEFGNFLDEQEKSDFKNINFNHKTSVKSKFTWFYQKSIWKDPWNNYNKKGQIENLKSNILEHLNVESE